MLTFTELENMEKQTAAEHEAYMARHDAYLKNREVALQVLLLARTALLSEQASKKAK